MRNLLVRIVLLAPLVLPIDVAFAQPELGTRICKGVTVERFEGRFTDRVRRYAVDDAMLAPFVELWRASRRPTLPVNPERVTVYTLPGRPILIGYQSGDCVIAFLTVERQRLWQWLRPRIGWAA